MKPSPFASSPTKTCVLRCLCVVRHLQPVHGGPVAPGCIVLTTAEVLLALLPDWQFTREPDAATGYDELVIRPEG